MVPGFGYSGALTWQVDGSLRALARSCCSKGPAKSHLLAPTTLLG